MLYFLLVYEQNHPVYVRHYYNNSGREFHSKFNSMIYLSYNNIFLFTEVIKNFQCDV